MSVRVSPRGAQRNEVVDLVEAERVERNIRARLAARARAHGVVYLLRSQYRNKTVTYVGVTGKLDYRLQQHNGERPGGAVFTRACARHAPFEVVCHVEGFPSRRAANQFEWAWKEMWQSVPTHYKPIKRRMTALRRLLRKERPTPAAEPFAAWPSPPRIVWHEASFEEESCF